MKSAYYAGINGGGTGSRSRRAQIAELEGKMPATRAAIEWGFRSAKSLRAWISNCEWHHVGKYANAVDYYDVAAWLEDVAGNYTLAELSGLSSALTTRGRELIMAEAVSRIVASNLKPASRFNRRGKSRIDRFIEVGVSPWSEYSGQLSGGEFNAWVTAKKEKVRRAAIERKVAEFKAKIAENLSWKNPAIPKRERRLNRLESLCGNHAASYVREEIKARKIPLTEANWKMVHASLYEKDGNGYRRRS